MQVTISELRQVMEEALVQRGLTAEEAMVVAAPFLEGELMGKKSHGVSKFFLIEDAIRVRAGKPEVIKDAFNYALIDAHKELGSLSALFAVDVLTRKAKEFGNAIVATRNSYYYLMAGTYARQVAEAGFVSVIMNNGGPAAVAPFGGVDPVLGTNPIAIGIPYKGGAIVLDMATSARTWGEINLAKVEGRELERDLFFDNQGNTTTNPDEANAIRPFGGAKGGGLNCMLEIFTGALVGAKMGLQSQNGYDLGFLFQAYSPEMFTTTHQFEAQVEQLVQEIKQSRTEGGIAEIFLPGEQAMTKRQAAMQSGSLEITPSVWNNLLAFRTGTDIKNEAGLIE